jgi:hypothetical protein
MAILVVLSETDARAHPDTPVSECTPESLRLPEWAQCVSKHEPGCLAADKGDRLEAPLQRVLNILGDFLEIFSTRYDVTAATRGIYLTSHRPMAT